MQLLGQGIRRARIERGLTVEQLVERAGVSRGRAQKIERGDPGCSIGAVFEAAAIVGAPLFDADPARLADAISANKTILTLPPELPLKSGAAPLVAGLERREPEPDAGL